MTSQHQQLFCFHHAKSFLPNIYTRQICTQHFSVNFLVNSFAFFVSVCVSVLVNVLVFKSFRLGQNKYKNSSQIIRQRTISSKFLFSIVLNSSWKQYLKTVFYHLNLVFVTVVSVSLVFAFDFCIKFIGRARFSYV